EQPVADPVRLDDPAVERVADAGTGGDQLQVRPGAGELPRQLQQPAVDGPRDAVLAEGGAVGRAAVPEPVGRVRVPHEQQRPGQAHGPASVNTRNASAASCSVIVDSAKPMCTRTQSPVATGSSSSPTLIRRGTPARSTSTRSG